MKTIVLVLFLAFLVQPSSAQVYKWVDEKGASHFTDDIATVPQGRSYDKIGGSEEKSSAPDSRQNAAKPIEAPHKDRLGRGEEYWKAIVQQWEKKLALLRDKVEALRIKYNELTEKFNDSRSTAERGGLRRDRDVIKREMDQYKIEIAEANEMLEKKIPEEARFYGAKLEWVKR